MNNTEYVNFGDGFSAIYYKNVTMADYAPFSADYSYHNKGFYSQAFESEEQRDSQSRDFIDHAKAMGDEFLSYYGL